MFRFDNKYICDVSFIQCTGSLATRVLIYQLYHEPTKLLLIGDGCSTATRAIAGTAPFFNLNTVSLNVRTFLVKPHLHPGPWRMKHGTG